MRARWQGVTAALGAMALVLAGTACQGGGGAKGAGKVLAYWASQQSPSPQRDKQILEPELRKFTEQTGVRVELEVFPFTEMLNKILTATTSGQGSDVLNIGNTWSPTMQATGAFVGWDPA